MGQDILLLLIGASVSILITVGYHKAVIQRAVKDIEDLGKKVDMLEADLERTYARKDTIQVELDSIREMQENLAESQKEIVVDVKACTVLVNQVLINLAGISSSRGRSRET